MREFRFFTTSNNIHGNTVTLDGDEHNHLSKVLRLTTGTPVTIISNDNLVRDCVINAINKRETILQILHSSPVTQDVPNITVFQSLIRADKMDLIVQKCTELGVREFIPFESKFCTVQDKGNKLDRYHRIVLSACKQSGRVDTMNVQPTIQFDQLLTKLSNFHYIIFANEKSCTSAQQVLGQLSSEHNIAIIVGCEGGFSEDEMNALIQHNAQSISMGKLILRAETACIALTSAVMYTLGEWKR